MLTKNQLIQSRCLTDADQRLRNSLELFINTTISISLLAYQSFLLTHIFQASYFHTKV